MNGYTTTKAIPTVDGPYVKYEDVAALIERGDPVAYLIELNNHQLLLSQHVETVEFYKKHIGAKVTPLYP